MTPIRLGALAIVALVIAGCADRDERARVGIALGDREEAAQAPATETPPPAEPVHDTTLILDALMVGEPPITATDQLALERTTQTTLETVPIGNESTWRNPQTGTHGVIAPHRTWQRADGRYCREFSQTYINETVRREAIGTACRDSDGSWKLAEG